MAVYDLEEQEKISALKAWWDQHGNIVSGIVIALCATIIAVQGWRWYTRSQAEKAAVLYNALSSAVQLSANDKAKDAGAQLLGKYPGSAYAARGALLLAKLGYDAGDRAAAKTNLQWVIDHASEDEMKQVARLRLSYVLLDEKSYDEALRTLDAKHDEQLDGLYLDAKGDILSAAGKPAEARAAYQEALLKLDPKGQHRTLVQMKLDSLGEGK